MRPSKTKSGNKNQEYITITQSFSLLTGAGGLRTIELRITPRVVQRGKNVTMACMYQVHDSGIYSVKWYKGAQEFYRYSPLESPTTRVLPVNGVKVDVSILASNIF